LDRRRVWATTSRTTALGTSSVSTHPSLVGGQGTRPSVASRHFAPSHTWLSNTLAALGLLAAGLVAGAWAFACACAFAMGALKQRLDHSLSSHTSLASRPVVGPQLLLGGSSMDAGAAYTLFSVLGGLDVLSASVPKFVSAPQAPLPLVKWGGSTCMDGRPSPGVGRACSGPGSLISYLLRRVAPLGGPVVKPDDARGNARRSRP
jgi:hypothetical protein